MPQPELMDEEGLCAVCKTPLPTDYPSEEEILPVQGCLLGAPILLRPGSRPQVPKEEAEFPHRMHRAQPPHLAQAWIQTAGPYRRVAEFPYRMLGYPSCPGWDQTTGPGGGPMSSSLGLSAALQWPGRPCSH